MCREIKIAIECTCGAISASVPYAEGQTGSKRMLELSRKTLSWETGGKPEEVNPVEWGVTPGFGERAGHDRPVLRHPTSPLRDVSPWLLALVVHVTPPSTTPLVVMSASPSSTSFGPISFLLYSRPAMRAGNLLLLLQVVLADGVATNIVFFRLKNHWWLFRHGWWSRIMVMVHLARPPITPSIPLSLILSSRNAAARWRRGCSVLTIITLSAQPYSPKNVQSLKSNILESMGCGRA